MPARNLKLVRLKAALGPADEPAPSGEPRDPLHDAAYRKMRQALMDGRFAPGQTFTLRTLAEVFGTSAMPVRDALKRLVAERALEMRANRSVVLPHMGRARFQEILQVRLALEPMLAGRGALSIGADALEAMAQDHALMCEAGERQDAKAFLAANRRFHFRLYESAGTTVILPIVEGLWMQVGPHLHAIFARSDSAVDAADHHHVDLLRALRRQDAPAAAQAVWDDLSDAADGILAGNFFGEQA